MQTDEARRATNRKYYLANKARVDELNRANKRRNAAFVAERKSGPCMDCGQRFHPAAMDFDHVRGVKVADVCTMSNAGSSLGKLQAEIDKCDLVCANCHRIRTYNRMKDLPL